MRGDGDGWVRCDAGHEHWGRHGAAGLLVRAPARGGSRLLLQHRALWSHDGGTWGIPGGARDSDESVVEAALRETSEETSIDVARVRVRGTHSVDHGGWSYTTVVADTDAPLDTVLQRESIELRWVPEDEISVLPLHHGFGAAWPLLTARPVTLVVDVANVLGARPDGWWKDRAGATSRLLARLAGLRHRTVPLPQGASPVPLVSDAFSVPLVSDGSSVPLVPDAFSVPLVPDDRRADVPTEGGVPDRPPRLEGVVTDGGWAAAGPPFGVVREVMAILEGAGRGAADADGITVVRAAGSGDDELVARVSALGNAASAAVVVTADRGLRSRLPGAVRVTGPRWLYDVAAGDDT